MLFRTKRRIITRRFKHGNTEYERTMEKGFLYEKSSVKIIKTPQNEPSQEATISKPEDKPKRTPRTKKAKTSKTYRKS